MSEIVLQRKQTEISTRTRSLWKTMLIYRHYYLLVLPGVLYFLIFHYVPMLGIAIAFKDVSPYNVIGDLLHGPWVGFRFFQQFMDSVYFWNVMENTLLISLYKLLWAFPASIVLALMLNEVSHGLFKRVVQTLSYLPHFLSMVIVAGILVNLLSTEVGFINVILKSLGFDSIYFMGNENYFRSVLVSSHIWQSIGWGSILYLAAIAGIDPQLYEAAEMDGAGRWRKMWHVTLPGIVPIMVLLLIFNVGGLLNAGFEQIYLLYSPPVYRVSDIIDTYVYREGIGATHYSYATAVGLFKNIISLILILAANFTAKKMQQESLF
ncbi:sugar ABC transporter permease [Paenibacillus pectinilyticus]|uniref:Sugar ABC transporter permease n=1 Tax=Paenibacillus pectinilyticus TaxID=512399 RepID=A0A1C0ZWU0_9BACL|nr:ABC transporter permease subunit [Paenibacillus pectinilyticus]OCT12559.1 sugar ABC transporter permease [Paenibacillus pectinilyticus]